LTSSDEHLVHAGNEGRDSLFAVTKVTALDVVKEFALVEATERVGELEGPQEVGGLLEVGADSEDLVDQILHADDAVLGKVLLDNGVVGKSDTLLVDLTVTTLVDELTDSLEVGVTPGDEGLDDLEHLNGGLGQADEDTVVDLEKTEELEGLALLGVDLVDTLDTDNEGELGLSGDVEGALLLGDTLQADLLALCIAVLLDVGLGALEDNLTLLLVGSALLLDVGSAGLTLLLLRLSLLEKSLRNDVLLGRDRAARRMSEHKVVQRGKPLSGELQHSGILYWL